MNVLLGLGGSDESVKTLRRTIERTTDVGDDLTVAIVDKPESKRSQDEMCQQAREALDEAGLEDRPVEKLEGDPGSALVDYAEQGEYDQLVIGGGTLSPMGKIQLGPITEFVLLNAPTTVKLVR
ncbi:UspA domain-containing protein [Natrinema pellirubrum DSM 15624]|uniref:Universal stress protein UspA-like protein n=2 Tax=Natrinema TaxID=88723 RepID=L0JJE8_NATP1|nr:MULTISPECIES: universal stress protein [Natrinema]ELZ18929.1 UspA domain-containing protein [Natrinema thermotolerans DSM 11552]AGB30466.1 universal stress protein UspA-like protein [Natrinema pellirubrum DSM 15624]ELY79766.1 UspA domain-containing protein [Natrinema pellirubrum DSM 15624]QCC59295.1 universal stress protein [Natrinema thermotolerans]WMT06263.1 universal stress protein [Natrinema thermotolerans]